MNRKLIFSLFWVLCVSCAIAAQVPVDVHVRILKAEDARRYDAELEKLITGNSAEPVLVRAMLAAGRIGDERAVPALTQRLSSPSPKVAEMAAFALGEIESISAADAILESLGSSGGNTRAGRMPAVQSRLVEAAGKIAAANSKDPKAKDLGKAIIFALESELNKGAQQSTGTITLGLTALLRARPEGTDVTAAKFLTHADARVRTDAANTLSRVRATNANLVLRKMLYSDPDPNARANAARALGAAEDKEAFNLLKDAAVNGDDLRVRVSAIRSLAALKDERAVEPLLAYGEKLLAEYTKSRKPNFIPSQQNEFIEVATALGRLLANSNNERADKLFAAFGKLDKGMTPEVYIARVRVFPKRGDGTTQELTNWKQYSTIAQVVGEFASIEPTSEVGKTMKAEAPSIIRPLAKAYAVADSATEGDKMLAAPDAIRAFARFKTEDLAEVLHDALKNKDVFVRATAAELVADLPASSENINALKAAFEYAVENDIAYNDATIAILDAYFKIQKDDWKAIQEAWAHPDAIVRAKATDIFKTNEFGKKWPVLNSVAGRFSEVKPYNGKGGTKSGQVLNTFTDYRRALSRKNGRVKAVLTTEKGTFTIDLLPEDAPLTVDNFVKLARAGYFNGLEVHRVVPNFVMQDGDPRGDGNGGPGWSIRCEVNMVPYDRGAVGMALSGKDTGGSQWFVTHSPQPHLDGGYTVFGRVNEKDMAVVDKIVRGDKIISVRVVEGAAPRGARRR